MANPEVSALNALGRIAHYTSDIADLERSLMQIPMWKPGAILSRQAAEARRMIQNLQERMDGRLVATLIGPSGAGKSTIFNAISGNDDLSATGNQRPTTRELVVLANDPQATRNLLGPMDDGRIKVRSSKAAENLDHLILVDTPDTDSVQSPSHRQILHRIVSRSDVLVCVFDAQNPKRRDHADFMAPLVKRFSGGSLLVVVNKCDRHDAKELSEIIGPDFEAYLHQAWQTRPQALLLISARSHLKDPRWDRNAPPRHGLDQFAQLQQLIVETMNQPNVGADRRIANAAAIRDYVRQEVRQATDQHCPHLMDAQKKMSAAGKKGMQTAISHLRAEDRRQIFGIHVRLYQALAQRWMGPVGWLVAVWSRLMVFGGGLAALVRFGNPLRQIWGAVSSWRRLKESRKALDMLNDSNRVDTALGSFRKTMLTLWPDIAESLIKGGFHPEIRELATATGEDGVGEALDQLWASALDRQVERYSNGLSHWLIQLIFNLPAVAMLGYVGWLTASGFFTGEYLSSDFFLHALLTIVIVLLLSFFIFQAVVRIVAGKDRIQRRAFEAMEKEADQRPLTASRDIALQVERVIRLAGHKPLVFEQSAS